MTGAHGLRPLLFIGGGIEALGTALFMFPRTLRVGGTMMLLTMTTALILDRLSRHWRIDLLIYLAGTYCVMVHEAVWGHGRRLRAWGITRGWELATRSTSIGPTASLLIFGHFAWQRGTFRLRRSLYQI